MIKTSLVSVTVGVLVAAAAFASSAALAQQKLVLKASDVHPAGYPTVVAVENLGKKLEKATNGRISVQMYPSMQLGGEKEASRAGASRCHRFRARFRWRARPGDRRTQRVQPAVRIPQYDSICST